MNTSHAPSPQHRVPAWRYRLRRFLRVKRTRLDGFTLVAYRNDIPKHVSSLLIRGDYEYPERRAVAAVVRPGDRVLEIGSCVGVIALAAAARAGAANVMTYEPNPAAYKIATENFATNNQPVVAVNRAVGGSEGEIDMQVGSGSWVGASALRTLADGRTIKVKVDGIRDVTTQFRPTVLIVDAEGMERDILPSADYASIRAVIVEFHPDVLSTDELAGLRTTMQNHGLHKSHDLSSEATEVWLRPE